MHELLLAVHEKLAADNGSGYGSIAESIPDFLAADYTNHSVFGGPAPRDYATMGDLNIVWKKLMYTEIQIAHLVRFKLPT